MRETSQLIIPIPKVRNNKIKVEVNGADLTTRIIESEFVYPATKGIGTFKLKISNAFGKYSNLYEEGQNVKFYADNSDKTTLQFWGRIDYVKEIIGKDGQFLEIEGRHRAFLLTEYLVGYSAEGKSTSQILKDIIDTLPSTYGFTYTNVAATIDSMDVEWNYKPFWDCVIELCNFAGYDCYVDNNLDFHYFETDSIINENDSIVEGDNLLKNDGWGKDDYYEKTRVTAIGQTSNGLPIVYTAISEDEGSDIKEVFIKDISANTGTKVKNLAEGKLAELTERNPQARVLSFGLEYANPGENILIVIPRQKIFGYYKVLQITHKFGMKIGGWRTECLIEHDISGISKTIQDLNGKNERNNIIDNINKLNYSENINFYSDIGTHSDTEITDGVLKLTSGSSTGVWISGNYTLENNINSAELRVKGSGLANVIYFVSASGGSSEQQINPNEVIQLNPVGNLLRIRVVIQSDNTQISEIAILYS